MRTSECIESGIAAAKALGKRLGRPTSEQSCNAHLLRTNESKCNRPEDSDVLSDTHWAGCPLPGAQETSTPSLH